MAGAGNVSVVTAISQMGGNSLKLVGSIIFHKGLCNKRVSLWLKSAQLQEQIARFCLILQFNIETLGMIITEKIL